MYVLIEKDPQNGYRVKQVHLLDAPPDRELEDHEDLFAGSGPPNTEPLERYRPPAVEDHEVAYLLDRKLVYREVLEKQTLIAYEQRNPESDDSWDYFHGATKALAELAQIGVDHYSYDGSSEREHLIRWIMDTPISDWYACDGDVRFRIATLFSEEEGQLYDRWHNEKWNREHKAARAEEAA